MKTILLLLLNLLILNQTIAEDLGVIGKTYPISETDMLEWIKSRANALLENGQWKQVQNQAINKVKMQINNPPPVAGISDATVKRVWYYTPIIELKQDLTDGQGHLLAKQGRYNALRYKPFDIQLLFINGNNHKQVAWAIAKNSESNIRTKVVLTQGSFINLDKKYKLWFYYDQSGKYTQKLGIRHVPALVEQEDDHLKVMELANQTL